MSEIKSRVASLLINKICEDTGEFIDKSYFKKWLLAVLITAEKDINIHINKQISELTELHAKELQELKYKAYKSFKKACTCRSDKGICQINTTHICDEICCYYVQNFLTELNK